MPQPGKKEKKKEKPEKVRKEKKEKKENKAKASTGLMVGLIITGVLLAAAIGVGVWGYFYLNGKLSDEQTAKKELQESLTATENEKAKLQKEYDTLKELADATDEKLAEKDKALSEKTEALDKANSDIDLLNNQIASMQDALAVGEAYSLLIDWADKAVGQGNPNLIVSDEILTISKDTVVYMYHPAEGDVVCQLATTDESVAYAELTKDLGNGVYELTIRAKGAGVASLGITDANYENPVNILVYVK